ncbi:MAG: imidazole glycerol phosphate synthase subunit HisH [Cyclobacteriaceae bacterium]|jgi:glutamine amidotransferase|nr:imidazole glycerol phosphate synthase subunit HisH [Cyclobacteriaceae bacterium]
MIVIVDYNAGNLASISNMLKKIGAASVISNDLATISKATKIILPGVGAFDYGMHELKKLGLIELLNEKKDSGIPILGICLGAQLMCNKSEEGVEKGLSWIDAEVKKFPTLVDNKKFTVPHMGWDYCNLKNTNSPILQNLNNQSRFYFVHSYYIHCKVDKDILLENRYSCLFHSGFEKNNIIGVQFHPEKSHMFGKQLLQNFHLNY